MKHFSFSSGLAVLLGLLLTSFSQGEFIIGEFLAENSGISVTDEDGFPADWIEIRNTGTTAESLNGYSLTDAPLNPTKWTFPDVTVPGGGAILVFASRKDRAVAGSELHTNFSLDIDGEYLALIEPDGSSIEDSFSPEYPQQYPDISYGLGVGGSRVAAVFVPVGAPLNYLIPTEEIGDSWKMANFDDQTWTPAHSAMGWGYSTSVGDEIAADGDLEGVMKGVNASVFMRMPFQIDDPAQIASMFFRAKVDDGYVVWLNGVQIGAKNDRNPLLFDSRASSGEEVRVGDPFENHSVNFAGNLVSGENMLAIQAMNSSAGSSDFIIIPELLGETQDSNAPAELGYFEVTTPGMVNGSPSAAPPGEVQVSVTSRAFMETFELTLSVDEPEATIYYTLDGTLPTNDLANISPEYSGPITIDGSTLVRSRAFRQGALPGQGRSEGYMKMAASEENFSSDLPVVLLSTFGGGAPFSSSSSLRRDVFMLIYEPDPVSGRTTFNSEPTLSTRGGYKKRGSSSANFPKYGMSFESWDDFNEDKDVQPLDFAKEADWILNARYTFDLSLMRNPFIYQLSNEVGQWASKTRFVELFNDANGGEVVAGDYFGVYTFMEKIKQGDDRVDISKLNLWENNDPDITGGYILKHDRSNSDESTFTVSGFNQRLVNVDPGAGEISTEQKSYISDYSNEITVALRDSNGIHPTTGKHFSEYLDVDSFVDHFWLNILVMDPDWGRLSQFFHKDKEGKMIAGPIWDYDRTMGSTDGRDNNPLRWEANTNDTSSTWFDNQHQWFGLLFGFNTSQDNTKNMANPQLITERPDIFQKIIDRWYSLRLDEFSLSNINSIIDGMSTELTEAQARNFTRWTSLRPGVSSGPYFSAGGTSGWAKEVSHLRGWLEVRAEWIDSQFFGPPTLSQNGGMVAENYQLSMSAGQGNVYYTLDGSDPRAAGGSPSASAVQGSMATLTGTTTVMARAYDGQEWGAPALATFVIGAEIADSTNLVISEIMYDPKGPTQGEIAAGYDDDSFFEYIELLNISNSQIDLTAVLFTDGLDFDFTGSAVTVLGPGERVLVVRNQAAFLSRYGAGLANLIAGEFANDTGLSGNGEQLELSGQFGVISDLTYNNKFPWPESSDGAGPSLVLVAPGSDPDEGLAGNWRPSVSASGSAGAGDAIAFVGDPNADLDGDGVTAFAEYALGTSDSDAGEGKDVLRASVGNDGRFKLTFPRNLAADDAIIAIEVSSNLDDWAAAGEMLDLDEETHDGNGIVTYIYETPDQAALSDRLFTRLRVLAR